MKFFERSLLLLGTWSAIELVLLGTWSALDCCCCLGALEAFGTLLLSWSFGSSRGIVGSLQLSCGDCTNLVRDRWLMALFLTWFSLAISPCFHWFYLVFTPTLTQTWRCLETFLFLMMISGSIQTGKEMMHINNNWEENKQSWKIELKSKSYMI